MQFWQKKPHQTHTFTSFLWKENYIHYLGSFLMCLHLRHIDSHSVTGDKLRSCTKISALALPFYCHGRKNCGSVPQGDHADTGFLSQQHVVMVVSHPLKGLWDETLQCWRGVFSQGKAVHSLCSAPCVDVFQLPYIGSSGYTETLLIWSIFFRVFFSVYSEREVALASQLHIMILPAATVISRAGVSCW